MFKKVVAVAAALLCGAASAATPITLTADGANQWSASFSALASGDNTFTLDLSALAAGWTNFELAPALVTANFAGNQGYDVTSVTFDGQTFVPLANVSYPGFFGADVWIHGTGLTAGLHTLVVSGNLVGGNVGFTGSLTVTAQPVPEPESYALMLAGLGAMGFIARRRIGR